MLKSPILSHPIQTQTKFKALLSLSLSLALSLSLRSRPMASSKPLSLQIKTQDPWLPQSPSLQIKTQSSPSWPWFSNLVFSYLNLSSHTNSRLSLSLSLDRSKPSATVVWCFELKTINQTQKGPTVVHGCGGQRWRIKAWGASAWVPHGETKVEDRMVVIGLKIGEGLKLMDVDVVGLKILDHWFWV